MDFYQKTELILGILSLREIKNIYEAWLSPIYLTLPVKGTHITVLFPGKIESFPRQNSIMCLSVTLVN